MSVTVACPSCKSQIQIPSNNTATRGKCRSCGEIIHLPASPKKNCSSCGMDVTKMKQVKNSTGSYFCEHCWNAAHSKEVDHNLADPVEEPTPQEKYCSSCGVDIRTGKCVSDRTGLCFCEPCWNAAGVQTLDDPPPAEKTKIRCPDCSKEIFLMDAMDFDFTWLCSKCHFKRNFQRNARLQHQKRGRDPQVNLSRTIVVGTKQLLTRILIGGILGVVLIGIVAIAMLYPTISATNAVREQSAEMSKKLIDDLGAKATAARQGNVQPEQKLAPKASTPVAPNQEGEDRTQAAEFEIAKKHEDEAKRAASQAKSIRREMGFSYCVKENDGLPHE